MNDSIYTIIEMVGTSEISWEEAAKNAVETCGASLVDLRIAEIANLDMTIENGQVAAYRSMVKLSFKYGTGKQKTSQHENGYCMQCRYLRMVTAII